MTQTVQAQIAYFGKIPSRGDFVKSAHNPQLLATLDRWIAEAMELLTDDPRWKIVYENAKPMHFAFLGSRSKLAIAGHMVASHDQSSRRFPFLAATALEVEKPLTFLAHSPLAFARLWSRVSAQMKPLLGVSEPAGAWPLPGIWWPVTTSRRDVFRFSPRPRSKWRSRSPFWLTVRSPLRACGRVFRRR